MTDESNRRTRDSFWLRRALSCRSQPGSRTKAAQQKLGKPQPVIGKTAVMRTGLLCAACVARRIGIDGNGTPKAVCSITDVRKLRRTNSRLRRASSTEAFGVVWRGDRPTARRTAHERFILTASRDRKLTYR